MAIGIVAAITIFVPAINVEWGWRRLDSGWIEASATVWAFLAAGRLFVLEQKRDRDAERMRREDEALRIRRNVAGVTVTLEGGPNNQFMVRLRNDTPFALRSGYVYACYDLLRVTGDRWTREEFLDPDPRGRQGLTLGHADLLPGADEQLTPIAAQVNRVRTGRADELLIKIKMIFIDHDGYEWAVDNYGVLERHRPDAVGDQ